MGTSTSHKYIGLRSLLQGKQFTSKFWHLQTKFLWVIHSEMSTNVITTISLPFRLSFLTSLFRKKKYSIYRKQCNFSSHELLHTAHAQCVYTLQPHPVSPKPHEFALRKKRFINFHSDAFICIFPFFYALFLWSFLSLWRQLLIFHHRREKLCVLSFMLHTGPTKCHSWELQSAFVFFSI